MKSHLLHPDSRATSSRAGWRWLALALVTMAGLAHSGGMAHAATLVIDDFTQVEAPSPWIAGNPGNHDGIDGLDLTLQLPSTNPIPTNPDGVVFPFAYDESGLNPANVIGGARRSELTVTASAPPPQQWEIALINILPAGTGIFSFESGLTVIAQTSLIYNGVLGAGAGSGTAFVTFNNYDFEDEEPLLVRLAIDDGLGGTGQIDRELNQIVNIGSPVDLAIPLGLGEFSGVNFGGSVNLKFTFFGNMADDFGLEQIVLEAETVPEPSTMALAALGLFGIAGYGLLRRKHTRNRSLAESLGSNQTHATSAPEGRQPAEYTQMHTFKYLLGSIICTTILLVSVPENFAALILKIDDGNTVKTIYDEEFVPALGTNPDSLPGAGAVLYAGSHGAYTFVVSTGSSKPAQGSASSPRLTLNTNATSLTAGAGTLTISLTDTDFTGVPPAFDSTVTTIANGSVAVMTYADFTNAAFGTGFSLSNFGPFLDVPAGSPGTPFAAADTTDVAGIGPYSLTIVTQIIHTASGTSQVTSEVVAVNGVPEPSTLALAGLGLFGLMAWGWKRSRKYASA